MDIIVWTDEVSVAAARVANALPYWVRTVRVFHRPTGQLVDEFRASDADE